MEAEGLVAWATPISSDTFTTDDALEHHRVVTAIFEGAEGCLPARFPTLLQIVPVR